MVVGWVVQTDGMGYGRGIGGAWSTVSECRVDRRTIAGLSPEKFSGQFSGEFSGEFFPAKKKKKIWESNVRGLIVCALVRLWLGFVRL